MVALLYPQFLPFLPVPNKWWIGSQVNVEDIYREKGEPVGTVGTERVFEGGKMGQKLNLNAEIPLNLREADERLTRYGRWAMERLRRHSCGSAEGRYRSFQDDEDRAPQEMLQHIDEAMACQRALAKVPELERKVLTILYVPQRLPIEAQLRIAHIPPRLCQERHLRGLNFKRHFTLFM